jgi:magnesium transporter
LITILRHRDGRTEEVKSIDRAWLSPKSDVRLWVDLAAPSIPDSLILSDTFGFHSLAVENAMSKLQYPKIEPYDGYMYLVLHGLDFGGRGKRGFATHDVDFFLGPHYLVTVHDGHSRSVEEIRDDCRRNHAMLGDGPVPLLHRIVDRMVDRYLPEVEEFEDALDKVEEAVFRHPKPSVVRDILRLKRDVSTLRRITTPQRDVIGRLARREFVDISTEMAFRFRDVYDHVVRVNEAALLLHDRITGILEAHLSNVSNRLNEVMKVLTVVSTIILPLTLLAGLWGMNVELPQFPGSDRAQFWWVFGIMTAVVVVMLVVFRRRRWL